MDNNIVNWIIDLQGKPHDLEYCAALFQSGTDILVEREQSDGSIPRYYLHSSRFEGLADTQLHAVAGKLIDELNAALKSQSGGGPVIMGISVTIRADGSRVPVKTVTAVSKIPTESLATTSATGVAQIESLTTQQIDTNIQIETLATSIVMANFARDWFDDARAEAATKTAAARRREIIFAVCTLESYLLEWSRDILLLKYSNAKLLDKLNKYFPEKEKRPITDKWKSVPKLLYRDKLIKDKPDLTGPTWQMFKEKVYEYYRNSLIHAVVSRPQKKVTASVAPLPDWKAELQHLKAGWATEIVAQLIRDLNDKAGTPRPNWLT